MSADCEVFGILNIKCKSKLHLRPAIIDEYKCLMKGLKDKSLACLWP